jgi:hypothetical protein
MHAFEDIKPGARLRGLDPAGIAEVVQVARFGPDALNLVFRVDGRVGERLVYRGEESGFEFLEAGRSYAFDADGGLLRLASEAYRIRLAYLFDPYLAVSASQIEALPHQITAVYGEMLPRQPLRFLLADDPGAGKTIMAGLLVKELLIRGDLERCLIVAPGSLVEQWQDEMSEKFSLAGGKQPRLGAMPVPNRASPGPADHADRHLLRRMEMPCYRAYSILHEPTPFAWQ